MESTSRRSRHIAEHLVSLLVAAALCASSAIASESSGPPDGWQLTPSVAYRSGDHVLALDAQLRYRLEGWHAPQSPDSMIAWRARIQLWLPRTVLISPLWHKVRKGCARSQVGQVLVL